MGDLFPIALDDMIVEAEREVAMRQRVYPRWVEAGKLTRAKADRQVAVMKEIVRTLELCRRAGIKP